MHLWIYHMWKFLNMMKGRERWVYDVALNYNAMYVSKCCDNLTLFCFKPIWLLSTSFTLFSGSLTLRSSSQFMLRYPRISRSSFMDWGLLPQPHQGFGITCLFMFVVLPPSRCSNQDWRLFCLNQTVLNSECIVHWVLSIIHMLIMLQYICTCSCIFNHNYVLV